MCVCICVSVKDRYLHVCGKMFSNWCSGISVVETNASAVTWRHSRMEWLPQHGLQPAGEPSGPKVTCFTLLLTPDTWAEKGNVDWNGKLSGFVICGWKCKSRLLAFLLNLLWICQFFPEIPIWPLIWAGCHSYSHCLSLTRMLFIGSL